MAKTHRKIPVRRLICRAWFQAHPVPLIPIRGEAAGAEEVVAGVEVGAEAEAVTKKRKWYYIFHKENDDHSSNCCPDKKRFEAILEEERKEKESECCKPFRSGLAKS
jgi:hypothetical protein